MIHDFFNGFLVKCIPREAAGDNPWEGNHSLTLIFNFNKIRYEKYLGCIDEKEQEETLPTL